MATMVIPEPSLVLLIGASGSGKSTFAGKHFKPTEIVSSDHCRALVCDDENDQSASRDAFELLRLIVTKRLARRRVSVVDATNVQPAARRDLRKIATQHAVPVVAIVLDLPEKVCLANNRERATRVIPAAIIRRQIRDLKASLPMLPQESFANIYTLETRAEMEKVKIRRVARPT